MMDNTPLALLIGVPFFFVILHVLVLPGLRYLSSWIQGEPFTYRLQNWMQSRSSKKVAKWDIVWSSASLLVAMAVTLGLLEGFNQVWSFFEQ